MKTWPIALSLVLALSLATFGGVTNANASNTDATIVRIQARAATAAPLGFQVFCLRTPSYCASDGRAEIDLTTEVMQLLNQINRSVNSSITPRRRTAEVWEIGSRVGDCKDYVMNKRRRLIDAGVPPGALRLAIAYTSRGEGHVVLIVRTNSGDLVLDNLTGQIKTWNQVNYRWVAMSSNDPRKWNAIG